MELPAQRRNQVLARIRSAALAANRVPDEIEVLAVSKRHSVASIRALYQMGQRKFGENYVAEALDKMAELSDLDIEWHYIGPIQSNKTRDIAEHFQWVHSVDREKILRRLNDQRPAGLAPLNCCLQLNLGGEVSKSGTDPEGVAHLLELSQSLPQIRVRGLMAIPPPSSDPAQQRKWCAKLRELHEELQTQGHALDTLSMGMSQDLEAAIVEGATVVRIGTALFGPRVD
jgi:pyridoxal phosphate enzyme (YggS family)